MLNFDRFLDGYHDVENQLFDYLKRNAEDAIAKNDLKKLDLTTKEKFENYRKGVRQHFLKYIGGLPKGSSDLKAEVTGVIEKDNFKVEKVIFQSLPNFYVTCNLYLPKKTEKVPGILYACIMLP